VGIAGDLIYIVVAALLGGMLARLVHQPLILGYVVAGVIVGPYSGAFSISDVQDIEMLAQIGIALLLFALGLEFSLARLKSTWRLAFVATPGQVLLSALAGYGLAVYLGFSWKQAVWFGAVSSLSSTMVVLKYLSERDALNSQAGRVLLGILIAQDLAVIPMILVLPVLAGEAFQFKDLIAALVRAAAFLLAMYLGGTKILPKIFSLMARWASRELFFLLIVAMALGAGYASYLLGLSLGFGAFVAGILLSETDFHHQALGEIARLRDLFGMLFFVSVGMLFDPAFFWNELGTVLVVVGVLAACKAAATALLVRLLGYSGKTPWLVGFGLAQLGEFGFLLAAVGVKNGVLSLDNYALIISATVVSMVLTPAFFWFAEQAYRLVSSILHLKAIASPLQLRMSGQSDHVVILGAGVVGGYVARVLAGLHIPYTLVEMDYDAVLRLKKGNSRVIFGDASHRVVLEAAGIPRAKLAIVTTPNAGLLPVILREIHQLNSAVATVVRVEQTANFEEVARLGVEEIVQPKLEAGLEMVRQALLALDFNESQIFALLGQLRSRHYELLGRPAASLSRKEMRCLGASRLLEFSWFEVKEAMKLHGASLAELKIRERFGVSVVGVIKGEELAPNPSADLVISPGDILGVLGTKAQVKAFRERMLLS